METVQSPSSLLDNEDSICISDGNNQVRQKKRYVKTRGKIRKAGFDADEISKSKMIEMQPMFKKIAETQLRETTVETSSSDFIRHPYMQNFEDVLTLDEKIWRAMEHYGIREPTPIQQVAIPYLKDFKNDLIVRAQTGSGKTFAFLLPIIDEIIQIKSEQKYTAPNSTSPFAVIVAPTAELTWQLACDTTRLIANMHNIKVAFGFGGLDMRESKGMLDKGCDLLFVPPGRLYHYFFEKGNNTTPLLNTRNIRYVVLDEADRLLAYKSRFGQQPGSGDETSSSVDENMPPVEPVEEETSVNDFRKVLTLFIDNQLTRIDKRDFHVYLFSATIDYSLFDAYVVGNRCTTINVGNNHPVPTVKQSFIEIKYEHQKTEMLCDLLEVISEQYEKDNDVEKTNKYKHRIGKTLIFVNNKRQGDRIAHTLLTQGYASASINADRSIRQRLSVIKELIDGVVDIVVATDVLSRGMNIPRVDYVINFDFPQQFSKKEYVHRVGRCGRIGNMGTALTFFDPKKDYGSAWTLIQGCKSTQQEIPEVLLRCVHQQQQQSPQTFTQHNNVAKNTNAYPPRFFGTGPQKLERRSPQQSYAGNRSPPSTRYQQQNRQQYDVAYGADKQSNWSPFHDTTQHNVFSPRN